MGGLKIRIFPVVLVLTTGVFTSCKLMEGNSSSSYVGKTFTTESGLTYIIHKAGNGQRAKEGDIVHVHYAGTLNDSTEFDNSFKRGAPIKFTLGVGQVIKGWDEGIALLNVGDSATLHIPANLAYGEQGRPGIPPNSPLNFDVLLVKITEPLKPYDIKGKDSSIIQGGIVMYKIVENKEGVQPANGQQVTVHYTGYFRDGRKFDSSHDRDTPFTFPLGQGRVIKGWDIGVANMRVGEKARLIIPYEYGYGEKGYGPIPAKATLVFDVEVLSIK